MKENSRIIAGTMGWGKWGNSFSLEDYITRIETCFENGITTFDHADIYGAYTTEAEFGNALVQTQIDREKIQIISKCGIQYPCENNPIQIKHYDYSKKHIRKSVEKSLLNLRTDYLDALLLHRPSPLMHPEEIGEIIELLKEEGKIIHFGVSNFNAAQISLLETASTIEMNQIECSLTNLDAMKSGLLDVHQIKSIQTLAWKPLGTIFQESSLVELKVRNMANKYESSIDQLLLSWLMMHPANIYPVIGTSNLDRLKNINKALEIEIELEDWFELFVESQGHKLP